MKSLIVLALALMAPSICTAEYVMDDDLTNCKWRDGSEMSHEKCDELKHTLRETTQRLEQLQEWPIKYNSEEWVSRLTQKRIAALDTYTKALMDTSFKTRNGRPGQDRKLRKLESGALLLPKNPDDQTPLEVEIGKIVASKKRECGNDYKQIYIGMKLGRLITCYGAYFEAKIFDPEGMIAIYQTMYEWVEVQNGIVINYTRRRD